MNWKIILAGFLIITLSFLSYIGLQFVINRNSTLNIPEGNQVTRYVNVENKEETIKISGPEIKNQNQLIRGVAFDYNEDSNIINIAMEQKQNDGSFSVIGTLEIKIGDNLITEYLCWPEFFETSNGTKIDLKKAYIGFGNDNYLYMKGETKKPISSLPESIKDSPYVFAKILTPLTTDLEIINETNKIGQQNLKELAILGCQ